MSIEQVKVSLTQNTGRPLLATGPQAIIVIDRLLESGQAEPLPQGWSTFFANTPLGELYRQLFAEADVAWPLSIVPSRFWTPSRSTTKS